MLPKVQTTCYMLFHCCSVTKLCPTLCDLIDSSIPASSTLSQSLLKLMSNHLILSCPFSSCPQCLPASGSFPVSWLFASGGQSIGASASASVFPMNIQGWYLLGFIGLISLLSKGLKSLLQHHNSKASVFRLSAFFMVQLLHLYMTMGKTSIALTIQTFVGKLMSAF